LREKVDIIPDMLSRQPMIANLYFGILVCSGVIEDPKSCIGIM